MLKKIFGSPFFIFPLLTCFILWPVSLQLFTFKNDALTYYYPVRTLIADTLRNGELPLWTPFINMGYPLHADMQSGAWNPLLWLIGLVSNYGLGAFHIELLLYMAMSGVGVYYLGRDFGWNKYTSLLIGIAFEFSGPMIDSVQFSACISSAAYIPFIFLFFRRFLQLHQPVLNGLLTTLFLYLFFTGGYPAFFIITVYLLAALFIYTSLNQQQKTAYLKKIWPNLLLLCVAFVLLSLPAIISFAQLLPYIDRGKNQALAVILENSMPPACMLSMVSPFSTTASSPFFNTDMLMRNSYMGILPLLFLLYTIFNRGFKNQPAIKWLFFAALLMFGMALGSHFFLRSLAYYIMPLMNTFRHPALFRFFGVFFLLAAAGFGITDWANKNYPTVLLKKMIVFLAILLLATTLLFVILPGNSIVPGSFKLSQLKQLFLSLDCRQRFLVQLPFSLLILSALYILASRKMPLKYMLLILVTDLFFATQLNMPVTVIGARSFHATQALMNRNSERFPLPINSIEQNAVGGFDSTNTVHTLLPFAKRIARNDYFITPGNLSSQEKFYTSPIRDQIFKERVLYFADTVIAENSFRESELHGHSFATVMGKEIPLAGQHFATGNIAVRKLSANSLRCSTTTRTPGLLVFLQNYYPGWKVLIDRKASNLFPVSASFMATLVPAGTHEIEFYYRPTLIIHSWYISVTTLLILLLYLGYIFLRKSILFKQHDQGYAEGKPGKLQ